MTSELEESDLWSSHVWRRCEWLSVRRLSGGGFTELCSGSVNLKRCPEGRLSSANDKEREFNGVSTGFRASRFKGIS